MSNSPSIHTDVFVLGQHAVLPSQYCAASAASAIGGIGLLSGPVFFGSVTAPQFTAGSLVSVINVLPSASVPAGNALTISSDGLGAVPYPTQGIIANSAIGHAIISTLGSGILINPPNITVLTPTFTLITNEVHVGAKNHTGASVHAGAHSQAGASTRVGAKADAAARCEAGPAAQNSLLTVAGEITSPTTARNFAIATKALSIAGKGFDIPHPTKENHRLRYICLEGPEVGAYIRGTLKNSDTIELPEYWRKLCKSETITVNLTPVGRYQELYVEEEAEWGTKIKVRNAAGSSVHCHYTVFAERLTNDNLQVEYKGLTPDDYPGDNSEYALGGWDYARHKGESKTSDL